MENEWIMEKNGFDLSDVELHGSKYLIGNGFGIMKHSTEMRALLNWQKISPPFGIFECGYKKSDDRLYDKLYFENDIVFISTASKEIVESAPAVMARGCDLP